MDDRTFGLIADDCTDGGRSSERERRRSKPEELGDKIWSRVGANDAAILLLIGFRRRSLPLATRDLLIQRSSLGGLAGVIGASAMVVDEVFSREAIGQWLAAGDPTELTPA